MQNCVHLSHPPPPPPPIVSQIKELHLFKLAKQKSNY
jgi:hypothetical protein